MKTTLSFEHSETKELLSKLDIEFFLKRNIEEENYKQEDVDLMFKTYNETLKELKQKLKSNKKQANYFLEGQTRKMFTGGFLPSLFHLDESRGSTIFGFKDTGNDLAYFRLWQKYYKRKVTSKIIWEVVTKIGSVLAIVLSFVKLWETVFK